MSLMQSPNRSHAFRSRFHAPPKSYQKPLMKPGYLSICVLVNNDSEPLVMIDCMKKRSSAAFTMSPAAMRRLSSSLSKNRSAIENSTNCSLALPRYSSRPKNGLSLPTIKVYVGEYLNEPSGQSGPQPFCAHEP